MFPGAEWTIIDGTQGKQGRKGDRMETSQTYGQSSAQDFILNLHSASLFANETLLRDDGLPDPLGKWRTMPGIDCAVE